MTNELQNLEEQFLYQSFFGSQKIDGWILNIRIIQEESTASNGRIYFLNSCNENFVIEVPFYYSLYIEGDTLHDIEEYIKRKYQSGYYCSEIVRKHDSTAFNHLCTEGKELLYVEIKYRSVYNILIKDFKRIIRLRKNANEEYFTNEDCDDIKGKIKMIHEYDIEDEIKFMNRYNIRCGKWFGISYDGEKYIFDNSDKMDFPNLKIFAFDIETTKQPLQFPNSDRDEIFMISIKTESYAELIINRTVVSQNVEDFYYSPTPEFSSHFTVINEPNEQFLIVRFIELLQKHKPHIITTYNGTSFDLPYLEKRALVYDLSLEQLFGFMSHGNSYKCSLMIHLDTYLWVKRDSGITKGVQGLKAVTKNKLSYVPEEIDPEEMCELAVINPDKLAKYSVSDAVATYLLFTKFVLRSVFTMCSIVPYSPQKISVLSLEAICEALLISQASLNRILVPLKRPASKLKVEGDVVIENITYSKAPVDPPRIGVYRSDFVNDFNINSFYVEKILGILDDVLDSFKEEDDFMEIKNMITKALKEIVGSNKTKGKILHFDIKELYAEIILTNRLQPTSIVNNDFCIRCEYSDDQNRCKKPVEWNSKVEFYPPNSTELEEIKNATIVEYNENVFKSDENIKKAKLLNGPQKFEDLKEDEQVKLIKNKIIEYSKKVYNVVRQQKIELQTSIVCQREFPFFYDTIKILKEKVASLQEQIRNLSKEKCAKSELENLSAFKKTYLNMLNSFFGYMQKNESRWFSVEVASIIYNTGTKLIKSLKTHINNFAITLDTDTSDVWVLVPDNFPTIVKSSSGKEIPFLKLLFNYFIKSEFSNDQFQEINQDGFVIKPFNTITLDIHGPYKCIFIPAALQEDKHQKKRHIVFNYDNTIASSKGFEMVRNGEINLVKKIQEDLISQYVYKENLDDCYKNLSGVAKNWLKIIFTEGKDFDNDLILHLLSDSKMINAENLTGNKSPTIINAAASRMAEILGKEILKPLLKVEYIISKYPEDKSITERVIPTIVFKSDKKAYYIKSWCKKDYSLNELIDWTYYKHTVERNIKRLIVLPAVYQGISNPITEIQIPKQVVKDSLAFNNTLDYCLKGKSIILKEVEKAKEVSLKPRKNDWLEYYNRLKDRTGIIYLERDLNNREIVCRTIKSIAFTIKEEKILFLDVPKKYCLKNKINIRRGFYPWSNKEDVIPYISIENSKFLSNQQTYKRLIQHIATRNVYEMEVDPYLIELGRVKNCAKNVSYLTLTTFNYGNEMFYVISKNNEFTFISKFKHKTCLDCDIMKFYIRNKKDILILNAKDINLIKLKESFKRENIVFVEETFIKTICTFEDLIEKQKELHLNLVNQGRKKMEVSFYSNIPLCNIDENYLDVMFLRELREAQTFCDSPGKLSLTYFKTEICNPEYTTKYCIMFECIGSLILSIVQYEKIIIKTDLYAGVNRKDLEALQKFMKRILLDYSKNVRGSEFILNDLSSWFFKESKILSKELRNVCSLIHQRFIFNIIGNLKKLGIKIIFVSKSLFCIETDKDNLGGCEAFFQYLQDKISSYEGYELLTLRKLHFFDRFLFFSPSNYFYLKNNELFSFSSAKVPVCYLKKYFEENLLDPHYIYDLITRCNNDVFKIIVSSLGFLKGKEDIISNCYRLTKRNEFQQIQNVFVEMLINCKECNNENIMRDRCIKCGVYYSREEKNEIIQKYFDFYLNLELSNDSYCDKCSKINERVLYNVCKCGGSFKQTSYRDILLYLVRQLTNIEEKEMAEKALLFYGVLEN